MSRSPADERYADHVHEPVPEPAPVQPARAPRVGDSYVDDGGQCENQPGEGCFLLPAQRSRLVQSFQHRVLDASSRYQEAAQALRVDKLLDKDDDLPWVLQMVLDFAGSFIGTRITQALTGLRSEGLAKLAEIVDTGGTAGKQRGTAWFEHAQRALSATTDDHLKAGVGTAIKHVSALASGKFKAIQNQPQKDKRGEAVTFLKLVMEQAALAYAKLRERIPAVSSDAEIITLWESFAPEHHGPSSYAEELAGKLARFEDSGVTEIARKFAPDRREKIERNREVMKDRVDDVYSREGLRDRDHDPGTFVVWRVFVSGYPKDMVFQFKGADSADRVRVGGEDGTHDTQNASEANKKLLVPEEFREVAIARHKAVWGGEPGTILIDDRNWYWDPPRAEAARRNWTAAHARTAREVHHPPGVKP
jgi:hypothetical protein